MDEKNRNGFDLGHELVEILQKADNIQDMDDAVTVFNQAYGVLRSQIETLEKLEYYGDRRL